MNKTNFKIFMVCLEIVATSQLQGCILLFGFHDITVLSGC